ncbi:MAG: VOC family protein [Nocardioidaceae bacterium]|nr:VOC family protein [Nocardioidaceae bacterium]
MTAATTEIDIPLGAPCWMDLMTSDVEKSVAFYGSLFNWTTQDTPPEFGGYKYFEKDGKAVGGCMLNQAEWNAPDGWSIYLRSDDVRVTAAAAQANGGTVLMEPMDVAENGSFAILQDAGGATISAWQPGTEKGFGVMREDNTPVHFELHTRDYDKTVQFYRAVFGWSPHVMMDTPEFRYTTYSDEDNARAGIMDATGFLSEGVPPHWSVYIGVADVDNTLASAVDLGGSVIAAAENTPYGRLAAAADPTGGVFKLRG